jgi:hypothetical protein
MAVQEIIATIDAYIARLKTARNLLASSSSLSQLAIKTSKPKKRRESPRIETAVPPPAPVDIPIRVIPPRMPRQRRGSMKPASQMHSPLGGQIPQGPVVIHSSEVTRMRSQASQAPPSTRPEQIPASHNLLKELTEEVARRLALGE